MGLSKLGNVWHRGVGYSAFLAQNPREGVLVVNGLRRRDPLHVGEVIKIARMRPGLDVRTLGTIVDVGANRGQFSLSVRLVNPEVRVIAVEPLPDCASWLRDAIGPNGRVIEAAAGTTGGSISFYRSAADKSSSALPMGDEHRDDFPWTADTERTEVAQVRLDEAIDPAELTSPVLLKLDVQGFELHALQGAVGLLPRVKHVLVEVGFREHYQGQAGADEVVRFLFDAGFHLRGVPELLERPSDGGVVQADLLFGRNAA
jgi:FkbM family methyltransferase